MLILCMWEQCLKGPFVQFLFQFSRQLTINMNSSDNDYLRTPLLCCSWPLRARPMVSSISRSKSKPLCKHTIKCWWRSSCGLFAPPHISHTDCLLPWACPVRQYDLTHCTDLVYPSSLSEARVYVSSVDINIGYIKLESRAVWVGGVFTADTSEALPSGCKHGQPRIQMDHFPLASLTRNSRRGLLLYSWVQQRCLLWLVWSNCSLVAPCYFWCLKILDLEESWQNLSGG